MVPFQLTHVSKNSSGNFGESDCPGTPGCGKGPSLPNGEYGSTQDAAKLLQHPGICWRVAGINSQKKLLASPRTGDSGGPQPRAEAPASGSRFFSPPVSKPVASRSGSILSGRFTTLLAFLNIFAAAGDTTGVAGLSFQLLMVMANGGVGSYSRFNL